MQKQDQVSISLTSWTLFWGLGVLCHVLSTTINSEDLPSTMSVTGLTLITLKEKKNKVPTTQKLTINVVSVSVRCSQVKIR